MPISLIKTGIYRNRKLLDLVRSMECVECGANDGTIVPAHGNIGKGMGVKQSDATVMSLCHRCHYEYDNGKAMTRAEREQFFYRNNAKTLRIMLERGLLIVDG